MQKYIQFKKERDLGEILSDTFKFIRENYKMLFKALAKYVGPIFLLQIFAVGFYVYSITDLTFGLSTVSMESFNFDFSMFLGIFFLFLTTIAFQSFLYGTIQNFIKSYINNKGNVILSEIGSELEKSWARYLGLGFLCAISIIIITFISALIFTIFLGATGLASSVIMVLIVMVLIFIPTIYLLTILSTAFPIISFEKKGILETISSCFKIIKDNWWITFFTLLIIVIVVYLMSMIFQVPILIYTMIKTFTNASELSYLDPSSMFDWVYFTLNVVSSIFQNIIYGIIPICIGFIYFNLNEQKNHTGAYESIENLGKDQ